MSTLPTPASKPLILSPDDGQLLSAFGDDVMVKVGGEQTGKAFALCLTVTAPGAGPPPHYHLNEDELFIVQKGRVEFFVEGKWLEPGENSIVYIPKLNVHTFRNVGDTPSQMLVLVTPAGFETFFSKCATEFGRSGGPDMGCILGIATEHGIHFVDPA